MKRTSLLFATIIFSLLVASCAPGQLLGPTITPSPTNTPTPLPTSTPTATFTPTSTPTATPTSTVTPSPTPDIRVIDINPEDLLLKRDDLPAEAGYYLPNSGWISPHRNFEIVGAWGAEKGKAYIERTGRVDGWWVTYNRGSTVVIAPQQIYDNVVLYKSQQGALTVLTEYGTCTKSEDFTLVESAPVFGDSSSTCIWRQMQSNGKNRIEYRIEFVYRNVFHGVSGWGWESEVRPEYIEQIAQTLLAKLQALPLSQEVTFKP